MTPRDGMSVRWHWNVGPVASAVRSPLSDIIGSDLALLVAWDYQGEP
ncbi:MAG TPA: hypothetical protein VEK07_09660 [Polyangiaceae bacterium]|nr:hypothetical protein [Polyangiaceae bacterium]